MGSEERRKENKGEDAAIGSAAGSRGSEDLCRDKSNLARVQGAFAGWGRELGRAEGGLVRGGTGWKQLHGLRKLGIITFVHVRFGISKSNTEIFIPSCCEYQAVRLG